MKKIIIGSVVILLTALLLVNLFNSHEEKKEYIGKKDNVPIVIDDHTQTNSQEMDEYIDENISLKEPTTELEFRQFEKRVLEIADKSTKRINATSRDGVKVEGSYWNKQEKGQTIVLNSESLTKPFKVILFSDVLNGDNGERVIEHSYTSAKLKDELQLDIGLALISNDIQFKEYYRFLFQEPDSWGQLRGENGRLDILIGVGKKLSQEELDKIEEWIDNHQLEQEGIGVYLNIGGFDEYQWDEKKNTFTKPNGL